jgi:hypothetical protein
MLMATSSWQKDNSRRDKVYMVLLAAFALMHILYVGLFDGFCPSAASASLHMFQFDVV